MNIAIDAKNHFHMGWIACLLGLPRERPGDGALKDGDKEAFKDGWDMCKETGRIDAFDAFDPCVKNGDISVFWAEDSIEYH